MMYYQVAKIRFPEQVVFEKADQIWVALTPPIYPERSLVKIQDNEELVQELIDEYKMVVTSNSSEFFSSVKPVKHSLSTFWDAAVPGILTVGRTKEQAVYQCYLVIERHNCRNEE